MAGAPTLIEDDKAFVYLNTELMHIIMKNKDFRERCHEAFPEGKNRLQAILEKARPTFFSRADMSAWLIKVKDDAVRETSRIAVKHHAGLGYRDENIDFEKVGLLAGMHDMADFFLNQMTAPIKNYSSPAPYHVLDKLEALDEFYLKTDGLPGYYEVQSNSKIKKHPFELKNLDDYWRDYLSLKDRYDVAEGFGDKKVLLEDYHREFVWQLVKIRPRADVKLMLDFHLKHFLGESIDFLDHIEHRIIPRIAEAAGKESITAIQLVKEWLSEKKEMLSKRDEKFLLEEVVSACAAFVNNLAVHKTVNDENKYNTIIRDLLRQSIKGKRWSVADQSLGGFTDSDSTANRAGVASRDLVVHNEMHEIISVLEFFRARYIPGSVHTRSDLRHHLEKIFRNEITGINPIFLVIYAETLSFAKSWKKYLQFLEKFDFANYELKSLEREIEIKPRRAHIKLAVSTHKRADTNIHLYHLFIDMNP